MAVFLAEALCDRLLDYEENVRKGVVAALCDVAAHSPDAIPIDTIKVVAERVRDKSVGFSLLFSLCFCFLVYFHLYDYFKVCVFSLKNCSWL